MKKLVLVRGLPGSGKTTYAKAMYDRLTGEGVKAKWLETSMYFEAYHIRFTKTEQAATADAWIKGQADKALNEDCTVIVANVANSVDLINKWKAIADKFGAEFEVIRLDTHWADKCPPFVLEDMKKKFEDYPGETVVAAEKN